MTFLLVLLACSSDLPAPVGPPGAPDDPSSTVPDTSDTGCQWSPEIPYDGIDQDCDGIDDDNDLDSDGFLVIPNADPPQEDCDDLSPFVFPGAPEIPYDGIDQDCDGHDWVDVDGDGFDVDLDCDDADPALNDADADGDGFTSCGGDCDDADATVYPLAAARCGDGVDANCDGVDDCDPVRGWRSIPRDADTSWSVGWGDSWGASAGDINGDGTVEVLIHDRSGIAYLYDLPSEGPVGVEDAIGGIDERVSAAVFQDIDGDGRDEAVAEVPQGGGGSAYVLLDGLESGSVDTADGTALWVNGRSNVTVWWDHDGDGEVSLLADTDWLGFYDPAPGEQARGDARAALEVVTAVPLITQPYDFDSDGDAEVILWDIDPITDPPPVWLRDPIGDVVLPVADLPPVDGFATLAGDFDGDGHVDRLGESAPREFVIRPGPMRPDGTSDGVAATLSAFSEVVFTPFSGRHRESFDFDGDGADDIVCLSSYMDGIPGGPDLESVGTAVFFGPFVGAVDLVHGPDMLLVRGDEVSPWPTVIGDGDGDGDDELVLIGNAATITLLEGGPRL